MKSILITGGTGSFGTAFAKRLLEGGDYGRICIYSRGEHRQAEMAKELDDPRMRFFIGDVRDRWRLARACDGVDVVVHAAALKRIEVGFYNPVEMVRTNIEGAINVVEAARDAHVRKVVALSTDKAFQPISPYGQSKALAERIFLSASSGRCQFAVTRYGNVWASAGSVFPVWRAMLAGGCRVLPITDPDCTRFFMRMREAVDFVLRTIDTMKGGELNIPDLPAYRLGDLVTALGAEQNVIGLPEWEKRHESMCEGRSSDKARRMSVEELRALIYGVWL
jgi:UDP-N-acetylglucosamine 4,6-dehydratase